MSKDVLFNKSKRAIPEFIPKHRLLSKEEIENLPNDENYVIWLGHSSVLLKLQGKYILTDPVFSNRPSPVQWIGTERFHPAPLDAENFPMLDIILISHDHYDHLDKNTIDILKDKTSMFVVPLAVGSYLKSWGVDENKIVELDWWDSVNLFDFEITATPARHGSGRGLTNRYSTLWSGFAVKTDNYNFYYTGDTGAMPSFSEIGNKLGPFDLTLVQLGAYGDNWPLIHMTPEEAIDAHKTVKGEQMLPIHWGTFNLALHAWDEPIIRAKTAANEKSVRLIDTYPGEIVKLVKTNETAEANIIRNDSVTD
jgi:L-ascorbate metabolism protein UlaG (beta-lactamase superfamily)